MVNTYFRGQSLGGHKPGGGMGSNKVVERSAPKAEPRARAVNPGAAGQLGQHMGNHATESGKVLKGAAQSLYAGPGLNNVGPRPTVEGPGGGRDVHHCGSQATHGETVGERPEPTPKEFPIYGGPHR
jgi:hypothetical protein